MNDNRCICCGNVIPEGRHVCPICEATAMGDFVGVRKDADRGKDQDTDRS